MEFENLDIDKIMRELSDDDKLRLLSGEGAWHTYGAGELPRVRMADGPCGVRLSSGISTAAVPATCFPSPAMLANSWDTALLYDVGAAIGREATALGVNLLLAPALNVKRNPLGGRNFEYYSEDPYLSGVLGKAFVSGVQSTGVGACIKHLAANNCETRRMYSDSVIDERALRELYLRPFEIALEAEPAAVMTAYNKLNGEYCSQNAHLIKEILRDELGYRGVAVSDWGGVHDRVAALKAGLDLEMPDSLGRSFSALKTALERGELDMATVDRSVRRILALTDDVYLEPCGELDSDEHDKLSYNAAADSIVLLKNAESLLPLTKDMKVAVVGAYAECAPVCGEGSSHVTPIHSHSFLDAFKHRAVKIDYYAGYDADDPDKDAELFDQALRGAKSADAVIFFAGLPAPSEGADRRSMALPRNQNRLISALAKIKKTVVVLCVPGAVEMPWVREVHSIIYSGLNGQSGALAAVDALYGRINPRGRLAETFPVGTAELGNDFGGDTVLYRESLFVGYKYFDAIKRSVLFPFGHGLSYSDIVYDGIKMQRTATDDFIVSVTLTNRSMRDGYETVQIYVADATGKVLSPVKQLAAFRKVFVEGDTTATAVLDLKKSAFSFYSAKRGGWFTASGTHKIIVAASAGDVKGEVTVELDGNFADAEHTPDAYAMPVRERISDADFAALYGKALPAPEPRPHKGEYTLDCCLWDMRDRFAAKLAIRAAKKRAAELFGGEKSGMPAYDAFMSSVMHTPLYAVAAMSDGAMSLDAAQGIVDMCNGKFFSGLKLIIKGRTDK